MTTTAIAYETLTCSNCDGTWERPVQRGRKPQFCDNCRRLGSPLQATPTVSIHAEIRDCGPRFHYAFSTLVWITTARENSLLVGPAGSGKSTAARQIAERFDLAFSTESCNPQMSKADILGYMNASGGFTPGVMYGPFKNGGVLLLDEIDASNSAVLVTINLLASVKVGEEVTFPNGENVARHADFILIAGANTFGDGASDEYVGREQLDAATLDRFQVIEWGYDETLERIAAGNDEWVSYVQAVRKAAAEVGASMMVTPRASIAGAKLLSIGMPRALVEQTALWKGTSPDMVRTIKAAIRRAA